jgi:ribosomal protein L16 Arg81 hydroxylase
MEPISRVFVPGLDSLVWPHEASAFVRDYWQQRPLHLAGSVSRLTRLAELLFAFDLEHILAAADLRQTIVQPPLEEQRRASPEAPLPVPMPEVQTLLLLHALGSQLYVAASRVGGVAEWFERLSRDLGRVWSDGRGDIYATREGGGARMHFDQNDNFTIQLVGRKVWFFSSERYSAEPLHNAGEREGVPYDPTYAFDPGRLDPAQLQEVVLAPGDMFYMPRGFLHGTRADEDSLSFNLSLGPQPWADVLLEGLRAFLIRDARMREGAMRDRATARDRADLFKRLVAGVIGEDFLAIADAADSAPADRGRLARRNPLSWWRCLDPDGEPCVTVEVRTPGRSATAFEVSRELLALVEALPDGPEPFAPDELLRAWGHDIEGGLQFIDELVGAGLLGWVEPESPRG